MSMLTIGQAYPEDAGIFTCQITANEESALSSGQLTIIGDNIHSVTTGQKAPKEVFQAKPKSVITINGGQKIEVDREQADALRKAQGKSGIIMGGSMMDNVLKPNHPPQHFDHPQQSHQFQPQKQQPKLPPALPNNKPPPVSAPKPQNPKTPTDKML